MLCILLGLAPMHGTGNLNMTAADSIPVALIEIDVGPAVFLCVHSGGARVLASTSVQQITMPRHL